MDTKDDIRQHLSAEKDKFKLKILESLAELYFLKNDGRFCDFQTWAAKEQYNIILSSVLDEDLSNEQSFSQLLSLKTFDNLFKQDQHATSAPAATTLATTPIATTAPTTSEQAQQQHSSDDQEILPQLVATATAAAKTTAPPPAATATTTTTTTAPAPTLAASSNSSNNSAAASIATTHKPTLSSAAASTEDSSPEAPTSPITHPATSETSPTVVLPKPPSELITSDSPKDISSIRTSSSAISANSVSQTGSCVNESGLKRKLSSPSETNNIKASVSDGASSPPPVKKPRDESAKDRQDYEKLDYFDDAITQDTHSDNHKPVDLDRTSRTDLHHEQSTLNLSKDDSPTKLSKVVEPIVTSTAAYVGNHHKQSADRVAHEKAIQERVAELRKQGLWSLKRLPKLQDPPRPKTHWDYVLEEMRWLSSDFDAERKWKRKAAKKCALMVYRYHHEKRSKIERAEREHLQHIKKLAATQAKEIRSFWSSIEKIVDYRQQTKLEETRKKALGLHLNYILDQTSKFSNTCLEDTTNATKDTDIDYSTNSQDGAKPVKETVITNDERVKPKHEVDDIAAGAQSIQPQGYTFETTTVSTKVPFLLKHSLREYQHIGLDWLVAMYNKKLNGILADEMGLGKTIQTIALLAHLACEKGEWGPHLIVVPTSVMLNWEMEFKKWCPAFKILTYYGNPKERRMKRIGWSRPNSFHVCITSYRIVIQDHAAFRRKRWCYFILDEAHYIKNFKSQRWQMLLNFNSQRRLLLTGTPLQNDLMELWSLMHFLMPNLFDSYREFKDWFVNPLTGMIEGSHEYNQEQVQQLHKILRPFLLRRLKADVEKQLPRKREFIKTCRLSKRQRFLYEEFMSLSKTKETLATGSFLSVINVLMQLRKVCNHPNLFEPRPTISPFMMESICYKVPGILTTPLDYNPGSEINMANLQLLQIETGTSLTTMARDYIRSMRVPKNKILAELDTDMSSDTASTIIDDDSSSVQEYDKSAEALNSEKVIEAFNQIKNLFRQEKRSRLEFMANVNEMRCEKADSPYFSDLRDRLYICRLDRMSRDDCGHNSFSNGNSRILCSTLHEFRENAIARLNHLTSLLDEAIKTPENRVHELGDVIQRFVFCVPGVSAMPVNLHVSHHNPSKKAQELFMQQTLYGDLAPRFNFLSKIIVNMKTSFPELRLIEYDCGKLQTLGRLLNELKSQDHRVLIFTQMSRMLDILEQFLNYHGHTYLRLDGATKVEQRQILMERFNNDKRIFCFILSTRSGGIGVNLTGADTVIFYDSDWNPTMDAQAQDRCHRIGQTRDVHIYRLISEDTIEKNIFMKAQQKRMLGDLAIEEGNFNTSNFKRHAIQELFNVEPTKGPIEVDKVTEVNGRSEEMSKADLNKLELALSKGEAEAGEVMDVDAIKVARADVDTDLREFDESIPLTEENSPQPEKSEKEQQIDTIVSQMTPVEQYAVKFLESLQKPKNKEELEQAEKEFKQELENKKSQWEQSRIEMLKEQSANTDTNETMITYPRGAKCDHVHYLLDGERTVEEMPLWAPPTPPTSPPSPVEENNHYHYQPAMTPAMAARINAMGGLGNIFGYGSDSNKKDTRHYIDEKDIYIDYTAHFLYEPNIMLESQLPPVNQQYTENDATSYTLGSKKIRITGTPIVPGGYFQTPSQLPNLQQHLQNLTNIPASSEAGQLALVGHQTVKKPKVRRDEVICLPKSIFDRQTPNFAKIRRELKLQKLRCVTKGNDSDPFAMQKFFHSFSLNPLGQSLQQETIVTSVARQMQQYNNPNILLAYQQDRLPPWTIQEEWALLMVLQQLQDLPVNLCVLTPGHTPNWELVSEIISDIGFANRSRKMCEYHFSLNVQKREMTRDSSWDERSQPPAKKQKKQKNQLATGSESGSSKNSQPASPVPFKPSKTGAMLIHDKSMQLSFCERYDIIKRIRSKKKSLPFVRVRTSSNPILPIRDYDCPLKPENIISNASSRRIHRIL